MHSLQEYFSKEHKQIIFFIPDSNGKIERVEFESLKSCRVVRIKLPHVLRLPFEKENFNEMIIRAILFDTDNTKLIKFTKNETKEKSHKAINPIPQGHKIYKEPGKAKRKVKVKTSEDWENFSKE